MEKLKELWKKLNLKVAFVGGVLVVTTNLGTCHLMQDSAAPQEESVGEEETTEESEETPEAPGAEAKEEAAEAPTEE